MQRVQKILSNRGYCSRRKAEWLIEKGKVKVNGKIISLGDQANENDKITVHGEAVEKQKFAYYMLHKPVGCVTALRDRKYKTVMSYVRVKERVFPVGRLDYNSSGLLLLTNDGDFANNVMHPSKEIRKVYQVQVDKPFNRYSIRAIEKGVFLEDGRTAPAKVKRIRQTVLQIEIHEGRNRIIRRMMAELGFSVRNLHRIRIGNLQLGTLKAGACRKLSEREKKKVFQS